MDDIGSRGVLAPARCAMLVSARCVGVGVGRVGQIIMSRIPARYNASPHSSQYDAFPYSRRVVDRRRHGLFVLRRHESTLPELAQPHCYHTFPACSSACTSVVGVGFILVPLILLIPFVAGLVGWNIPRQQFPEQRGRAVLETDADSLANTRPCTVSVSARGSG
ncbi:hypothetical protein BJ138DRAFT_1167604 [Hygrophoropsis aurantiaca]|uniref:Uncharacterized protein n=1 Tax=Hygrophoropsis aurantiaca TaxID=72124 RepID=A0ACB7ZRL4_9AGAM|nr:hypothetical protein BJ138DRAFT_1167604 [Hygrophoropsis aurantiaca]